MDLVFAPGQPLDPRTTIDNCGDAPLYVYADGCFGTVIRLERLDGTIETVDPPWACAWAGPTNPVVVDPSSAVVLSNQEYGNLVEASPGTYRFVYWVTYDFVCPGAPPPGGEWPCALSQPWVELATPPFTTGG